MGVLSIALLCLVSCGAPKELPTSTTIAKDSVRVEYRERLVWDTAYVEIPRETERITTRDTFSRLDNSLARSEAGIRDGLLYHSLETKPGKVAVPVAVSVRDTIYIRQSTGKERIIETRNELTRAQRRQIVGFWALLAIIIAVIGWKVARFFRR